MIARALRDAGMEVIYTGIFQSPESIANTVVQEDADVLGISSLSGAHLEYAEDVMRLLREHGRDDVLFLVGGTVPDEDVERLTEIGIDGVFGPGYADARRGRLHQGADPSRDDRGPALSGVGR